MSDWLSKRLLVPALSLLLTVPLAGQLGRLMSPGPLSRAHANLEGAANCVKCHEQARKVSPARCLACHEAIATRIAARKGVHRNAGGDCVNCHTEHAGRDADIRAFDPSRFDHAGETGFRLDGRHAPLRCNQCHKTRSYLAARPQCTSCHADPHKPSLGTECARCHSTAAPFATAKEAFDHARTAFPLEGAHRTVACAKCHPDARFTGLRFRACSDCHRSPHQSAAMRGDCGPCHTPADWKVARFEHGRTGTPLRGKHARVACSRCHVRPATEIRLRLTPCSSCHRDPHRGAFARDCGACHDENGFKGAPFDHAASTRFPLQGRHRALACSACHKQGPDFRGLSTQCVSCHADPHRAQFGVTCEKCHGNDSFLIPRYEHPRFPEFFRGRHAAVACEQCHRGPVASRVYRNLSTACATCHRDVHQGQFASCGDCHSVDAPKFAAVRFDHTRSAFPLTGRHAATACSGCHPSDAGLVRYKGTPQVCASCHKDPHLGQLGADCASCHETGSFRIAKYVHRNPGAFFRGRHATASCGGCHRKSEGDFPAGRGTAVRFTGLGGTCANCHADPHGGQLGASCERCHSVDAAWSSASRAFHKAGLFPLEGQHLVTPCAGCHRDGVTRGTPSRCYDCHWIRRQDDRYHTRLGNECEDCHRPTAWSAVSWNHGERTAFALSGAHTSLACDQCHRQAFGAVRSDCASCHAAQFAGTREPDHRAAGFPEICQLCHRPSDLSWQQGRFTHETFELAGTHQVQPCGACHRGDVFAGTARNCAGCHRDDYERSASPAHAAAGFGTACDECHRFADARWSDAPYDHGFWPLLGSHITPGCEDCHTGGVYRGRPTACASCHQHDYDRAVVPNHAAAGFPLTCELCHRLADSGWDQGRFDHTSFALAGVHATQGCAACHVNAVYAGTPRLCAGCHLTDYNGAADPSHLAAAFPTTCDTCHGFSDANWDQGRFDHTTFALAGVHLTQGCAACHVNGVYAGTPRLCAGCHLSEFNGATNPNHLAAAFPTTCDTCHKFTDATWDQGVFNHVTFPLAGVHATKGCADCHINGVYAGTPRLCSGCHLDDYNRTTDPNHVAAGFPTTCESCHKFSDASWDQGVFSHNTFPLAGVHSTRPCAECHLNGVYAGTSRLCSGCHLDDYNRTTDPNHAGAGFPITCENCHRFSDASWNQGVFNHRFPIRTGPHAGNPCSACHINPAEFRIFSCTANCHDRAETDSHHREVSGYRYESLACYACHPQGRSE